MLNRSVQAQKRFLSPTQPPMYKKLPHTSLNAKAVKLIHQSHRRPSSRANTQCNCPRDIIQRKPPEVAVAKDSLPVQGIDLRAGEERSMEVLIIWPGSWGCVSCMPRHAHMHSMPACSPRGC